MKKGILFLLGLALLAGCDEDPPVATPNAPAIDITLKHTWKGTEFQLNKWYTTTVGDSFQPTTLNYHINHIELIDDAGIASQLVEWDLVNFEKTNTRSFTLDGVEGKKFTKLRFTLGVEDADVNKNGELNDDFTDPMYWGMAMGYINLKLEGKRMTDGVEGNAYFHIGGYEGVDQTARIIEIDLTKNLEMVLGNNTATLSMDVDQFFHSPNDVSLPTLNDVQVTGSDAVMIAENFDGMFTINQ